MGSKDVINLCHVLFFVISSISPIIQFLWRIKFNLFFQEVEGIQAECLKTLQTRCERINIVVSRTLVEW